MIEELECLEFQLIISIYGCTFLKIYFLGSLSKVHILRILLNIQAGECSCLNVASQKISASRLFIF